MERLAVVADEEKPRPPLPPVPRGGRKRPLPAGARLDTLVSFGVGALMSATLGGVAFVGLKALVAGGARLGVDRPVRSAAADAAPAEPAPRIFEVAIDRKERAHAPFGLELKGTENDSLEVVLHGIPATALLNRGERRGARTWVVKRGDLDGLYLTLGDAAPDAFDVRTYVMAPPPGVSTVGSVLRVRLVDKASPALPATAASGKHPADHRAKSVASAAAAVAKVASARLPAVAASDAARRQVTRAPARRPAAPAVTDAGVAAVQSPLPARRWPEGASGLGALPRDSERQVWWTMPQPSWSPFRPAGTQ